MPTESKERIIEGAYCTVDACACGVLHVSLGSLTVRLQKDVVESIWLTLGEALHRLDDTGRRTQESDATCRRITHAKGLS
jgi:hypothetical protein